MLSVSLTAAQRTNVIDLRDIQTLSDRATRHLSTGKKVNTVVDNAVSYFTGKALADRSSDILLRKEGVDQAISTLEASINATDAIDSVLKQMKGLADAARSQTTTERVYTTEQFNTLGNQIGLLVKDATYSGLNMLDATSNQLDVRFSDLTFSRLTIGGYDLASTADYAGTGVSRQLFSNAAFTAQGGFIGISVIASVMSGGFSFIGAENSNVSTVDTLQGTLDTAIERLRSISSTLGLNVAFLTTRSDFSQNYADTLAAGGDKLTLADMNEEGAKLTALQTSQQLGVQALRISGQQGQQVLTLVRT